MTSGWRWLLPAILMVAAVGVATAPRDARRMALAVGAFPVVAFLIARLGNSASPESRHLIFVMPFFALCLVAGLLWLARDRLPIVVAAIVGLMVAQVSWAWHKTAPLFEWEPTVRQEARKQASAYLAATSRPDDLLLGYDPLFMQAWEENRAFATTVLPRADGALALKVLRRTPKPLGRGVWVLDRSDNSNVDTDLFIGRHVPLPPEAFVSRNFGPFLVIRTREPVETIDAYLFYAGQAMLLGRALEIADASINRATVNRARRLYDESIWGPLDEPPPASSR